MVLPTATKNENRKQEVRWAGAFTLESGFKTRGFLTSGGFEPGRMTWLVDSAARPLSHTRPVIISPHAPRTIDIVKGDCISPGGPPELSI